MMARVSAIICVTQLTMKFIDNVLLAISLSRLRDFLGGVSARLKFGTIWNQLLAMNKALMTAFSPYSILNNEVPLSVYFRCTVSSLHVLFTFLVLMKTDWKTTMKKMLMNF